ncbi:hypothetical protein MRB53_008990 [Persea americana]|uniref:Uncharacterized protein n=1 Tax=Persea americana TaxID=3435 RepID=A0ACC2LNI6_PERAE|nr:hypothetical protein MRB53_008990 [Persea americana]
MFHACKTKGVEDDCLLITSSRPTCSWYAQADQQILNPNRGGMEYFKGSASRDQRKAFNGLVSMVGTMAFQGSDLMQYDFTSAYNSPFFTTNSGAPVWNNLALTVESRDLTQRFEFSSSTMNFMKVIVSTPLIHKDTPVEVTTLSSYE